LRNLDQYWADAFPGAWMEYAVERDLRIGGNYGIEFIDEHSQDVVICDLEYRLQLLQTLN